MSVAFRRTLVLYFAGSYATQECSLQVNLAEDAVRSFQSSYSSLIVLLVGAEILVSDDGLLAPKLMAANDRVVQLLAEIPSRGRQSDLNLLNTIYLQLAQADIALEWLAVQVDEYPEIHSYLPPNIVENVSHACAEHVELVARMHDECSAGQHDQIPDMRIPVAYMFLGCLVSLIMLYWIG